MFEVEGTLKSIQNRGWQTVSCGANPARPLFLAIKFYWNTASPIHLHIICGCVTLKLQSRVVVTDGMTHKASNIYCLVLDIKGFLTPDQRQKLT